MASFSLVVAMKIALVLVCFCLAYEVPSALGGKSTKLPAEFTSCPPGDDECLKTAISAALKLLKNGIPSIGAVPMDPLHVTEVDVTQDSGSIKVHLILSEIDVLGFSEVEMYQVKSELGDKNYRLELKGKTPALFFDGDYKIDGNVLVLPISGSGKVNLTYTDVDINVVITGHVVSKKDVEYVSVDDVVYKYRTSRFYLDFSNLFNGNRVLGYAMNKILNDNWTLLERETNPLAGNTIGKVLLDVVRKIYDKVPYRRMHPRKLA